MLVMQCYCTRIEVILNLLDGLEMKVSFDRQMQLYDQLSQLCLSVVESINIIDKSANHVLCVQKAKSIVVSQDPKVVKRFIISIGNNKLDVLLKNILSQSEWTREIINICHHMTEKLKMDVCKDDISIWANQLIESIISFGMKSMDIPDIIMDPFEFESLSQWYDYKIPVNYEFIEPFTLNNYLINNNTDNYFESRFDQSIPWPHTIIDNIIKPNKLNDVLVEINNLVPTIEKNKENWRAFNNTNEVKYGTANNIHFHINIRTFINELKSVEFIRFLERLTKINGLIPDPWDVGGGVHVISTGGYLKVHTDFPFHSRLRLYRRVNLLLYLNKEWKDEWGGQLELWDDQLKYCHKRIVPLFNRMVIFRTDNRSFHGHPYPLKTPVGVYRKSIALYYYSSDIDPGDEIRGKSTYFTNTY